MSSVINASISSNGIVSTADASGILQIQSNGKNTNAQAWVQFSGATGGATINQSYNVSSITRNSAGDYTINFTNAFASSNFSFSASCGVTVSGGGIVFAPWTSTPTTTTLRILTANTAFSGADCAFNSVIVFSQ